MFIEVEGLGEVGDVVVIALVLSIEEGGNSDFVASECFANVGEGKIFGCFSIEECLCLNWEAVAEGSLAAKSASLLHDGVVRTCVISRDALGGSHSCLYQGSKCLWSGKGPWNCTRERSRKEGSHCSLMFLYSAMTIEDVMFVCRISIGPKEST